MQSTLKKAITKLYTGFSKTKAALLLFVVALYLALVSFGGGSVLEFLLFAISLAAYIVLPGLLAAQLLNTKKMLPHFTAPFAILLGSGFFAALYCVSMRLNILWLLHVLPPVLAICFIVLNIKRFSGRNISLPAKDKPFFKPHQWMLILLFAALLLLYTFSGVAKNGRPQFVGNVLLNQDLLWNVGNANSFKIAFPPEDIRFFDVRLHYHYLTELLVGALSIISGISAYNIIAFYLQAFMLVALIACLYSFARFLWQKESTFTKPLLFTYSMFLFSCASLWKILPNGWSTFNNSNTTHLITNINSQATAIIFLCIFLGLYIAAARQRFKVNLLHYLIMLVAFFMLIFAKGPLAAIVILGIAAAQLVGIFLRNTSWQGLLFTLAAGALFVFIYIVMFSSGANNSMPFSLSGTLEKGYFYNILYRVQIENPALHKMLVPALWVVQSFLMLPAQFPFYIKSIGSALRNFKTITQEHLLFHAVAIGGLAAFFLFNHPAMSQIYFLFGAIFFINILAVDSIGFLHSHTTIKSKSKSLFRKALLAFVAFCAAIGIATTAFLYINMLGSGARQLAFNLGIIEKYPYDVVVTKDDELAMLWVLENTPQDAMFATNRIHTGARREGISNLYSAFCERQGFMEGFQYAITNMGVSANVVMAREAVNNALFAPDTLPTNVISLCQNNNISYIFFSSQFDGSNSQLSALDIVYDSPSVQVYAVPN